MGKRRKHADLIHAYAEGAEIEYCYPGDDIWRHTPNPSFNEEINYRLKEEKPKPFLAWVWNFKTQTKRIRFVIKNDSDGIFYEFIGSNFPDSWTYAQPLTPEEVTEFTYGDGDLSSELNETADGNALS